MAWNKLDSQAGGIANTPSISIQKTGKIAWNEPAQEALGKPEHVEVLIDDETALLGVKKTIKPTASDFAVKRYGDQKSWSVSAKRPLKSVGIEPDAAYRQQANMDNGVLTIKIGGLLPQPKLPGIQESESPAIQVAQPRKTQ